MKRRVLLGIIMLGWRLRLLAVLLALSSPAYAQDWIRYYPPSGGGVAVGGTNVWTGDNRFTDSLFFLRDDGDVTKLLQFQASGITTGTTRTLTMPNVSDTLAVLGAQTFTGAQTFVAGGSFAAPAYIINGMNVWTPAAGFLSFGTSTNPIWITGPTYMRFAGTYDLGWTPTDDTSAAVTDTSLRRHSAAVVRVTAGSGSSAIHGLLGGGAAVASAPALPLPTGNVFHVTGVTNITSITSTNFAAGACITIIFDGVLTLTDGNNLVISGNFVTTADDTWSGCYDGANWYETMRSVN